MRTRGISPEKYATASNACAPRIQEWARKASTVIWKLHTDEVGVPKTQTDTCKRINR